LSGSHPVYAENVNNMVGENTKIIRRLV